MYERDSKSTGNSNWQADAYIIDLIHLYNPVSILDLGVGKWAKMGTLIRRSFDEWNGIQYGCKPVRLDGVEGFSPNLDYVFANSPNIYDNLFSSDIREYLSRTHAYAKYDVAILGDVLEHFVYSDANYILFLLEKMIQKAIIVQLPLGEYKQELELNPLENHRHTWTFEDIQKLRPAGLRKFTDYVGRDFIVFAIPK
jgi:hypothetical protein